MKIFHASDLHFNVEYFKHISALEDKFDIFCFSGDLLDGYSPLATQIEKHPTGFQVLKNLFLYVVETMI